jgi:2-amino-4-hydroxy-6-hydroxymethyldihydropteridine diphosphokinase
VTGARGVIAFIGLGSNLGDREAWLRFALARLSAEPGIRGIRTSRVFETDPVGGPPQGRFLNAAISCTTDLTPRELLDRLLAIERAAGRERRGERDLPRPLDLDLLLYGDRCIDEPPELVVPHPRLHLRAFVLAPLCDLAPELRVPTSGRLLRELLQEVDVHGLAMTQLELST